MLTNCDSIHFEFCLLLRILSTRYLVSTCTTLLISRCPFLSSIKPSQSLIVHPVINFIGSKMPYPKVSPEVVVAISFGIVMFLLTVVTVWQGQKHRHDFGSGKSIGIPKYLVGMQTEVPLADEEDQRGRYWPGFSGSSATRSTSDQLLTIRPSLDPCTRLNGTSERSSMTMKRNANHLQSSSTNLASRHISLLSKEHHLRPSLTEKVFHSYLLYLPQLISIQRGLTHPTFKH